MLRQFTALSCVCLLLCSAVRADDTDATKDPNVLYTVVTTKAFYVFRLNPETGALFFEAQADNKFVKTGEAGDLPKGSYALLHHDTGEALYLFRVDRVSGKAWYLAGDKMAEVPEIDAEKAPKGKNFKFYIRGHETTRTAFWLYRFDPRSGATWKMAGLKWQAVAE